MLIDRKKSQKCKLEICKSLETLIKSYNTNLRFLGVSLLAIL